jgi:hypothetical protein
VLTSKISNFSHDHEAISEWTTAMARAIDLEGIATDGFGYTVTISGPLLPKPEKKGFSFPWSKSKKTDDNALNTSPTRTSYTRKTEVMVQKTWRSPSHDLSPSSTLPAESRFNSVSPKGLDEMTFESMGLHMNGLLGNEGPELQEQAAERRTSTTPLAESNPRHVGQTDMYLEDSDEEDIQALPQVRVVDTRHSHEERNKKDIRDTSWFGDAPPTRKTNSR